MLQLVLWMVVLTPAHAFGAWWQPSVTCRKGRNGNEHLKRLGCAGRRVHWAGPLLGACSCQATLTVGTHSHLQRHCGVSSPAAPSCATPLCGPAADRRQPQTMQSLVPQVHPSRRPHRSSPCPHPVWFGRTRSTSAIAVAAALPEHHPSASSSTEPRAAAAPAPSEPWRAVPAPPAPPPRRPRWSTQTTQEWPETPPM